MFREALTVILKGLSSDRLTHHGEHYNFDGVPMAMRPVQKPHPPVWAGVGGKESQAFAAEIGMNMMVNGPKDRVKALVESATAPVGGAQAARGSPPTPVETPFLGGARQIHHRRYGREGRGGLPGGL